MLYGHWAPAPAESALQADCCCAAAAAAAEASGGRSGRGCTPARSQSRPRSGCGRRAGRLPLRRPPAAPPPPAAPRPWARSWAPGCWTHETPLPLPPQDCRVVRFSPFSVPIFTSFYQMVYTDNAAATRRKPIPKRRQQLPGERCCFHCQKSMPARSPLQQHLGSMAASSLSRRPRSARDARAASAGGPSRICPPAPPHPSIAW